jgi:hypothetical protein
MKLGTPDSMPRGESLASLSAEGEGAWEALEGGKRGWGEGPGGGTPPGLAGETSGLAREKRGSLREDRPVWGG